ncbi:MAG: FMN-binding protein [Candidatus Aminicenantia bacterium]
MNIYLRMIIVLTSIGLISGLFLAGVGTLTKERIALNKQREINEAIIRVVPGTIASQKLYEERSLSIFEGRDENNNLIGYAVYTAGVGFQDKIYLMVGLDPEISKIYSLTIIDQKETPGLGGKITSQKDFLQFWENKDCTQPLRLHKPAVSSPQELSPSEVNTITGATVSSEAVVNMVNDSLTMIRDLKKEGKLDREVRNGQQ